MGRSTITVIPVAGGRAPSATKFGESVKMVRRKGNNSSLNEDNMEMKKDKMDKLYGRASLKDANPCSAPLKLDT
jgi:hypothetical protein